MHILLDGDEERLAIFFINASEWVLFDFFCNTLLIELSVCAKMYIIVT